MPEFVYQVTKSKYWDNWIISNSKTGTLTNINSKQYSSFRFPLPQLEVQKNIVAEIESYQCVIDGARTVIDNWKPKIVVDPEWPMVELGNMVEVIAGQSPPGESYNSAGLGTPFYQGKTEFGDVFIGKSKKWTTDPIRFAEKDDVLMSVRAPVGPVNLATQRICIGRGLAAIRPTGNEIINKYTFYILRNLEAEISGSMGAAFSSINLREIRRIKIPLPPLETQHTIVAEIDGERSLTVANHELIQRMQSKIETVINQVWGKR